MIEGRDFFDPLEEDLARLGSELRRLPTPMPSPALLDRVRRLAHLELAGRGDERLNRLILAFLLAFSWTISLVAFAVVRLVSGEGLELLGIAGLAGIAGRTGLAWSVTVLRRGLDIGCDGSSPARLPPSQRKENDMSSLRRQLRTAPSIGIALSALSALAAGSAFLLVGGDEFPVPGRIAASIAIALLVFTYGFLVSYVYGDARRRGMRHVVWALVAALVPNALGFIAYFLLREPLLQPCPSCGAKSRRDFAFCPQCGSPLPQACMSCRRPVEPGWSHCAHCGKSILGATPTPSATAES